MNLNPRNLILPPRRQFMEPDNSFENLILGSQGGFRAGQLTGLGHRVRSTHTSAGGSAM
jgi:hypothetical protein